MRLLALRLAHGDDQLIRPSRAHDRRAGAHAGPVDLLRRWPTTARFSLGERTGSGRPGRNPDRHPARPRARPNPPGPPLYEKMAAMADGKCVEF